MNLIVANGTAYNKYINNNKINDCPITSNYIINYFNRYYLVNVFIHRDITHFITLFFNFFEVTFFGPPDRNGGEDYDDVGI
jgi:hypothetical protein